MKTKQERVTRMDLSKDIVNMLEMLGSHGKDPAGGITRFLYSEEWVEAQKYLEREMENEGLDVSFDAIGNLFGTLKGSKFPEETVLSGSHVDTVRNGGYYDGQYGIVAAFIAIKYLKEKYGQPLRNLEMVSMAEEEGSRFPYGLWGSKNIVGIAKKADVEKMEDSDGVPFVNAMTRAGFAFRDEETGMRDDLKAFVELHVEQGNVLESEKKSVGVVHSIVGQRRFNIELTGQANHAGTTPMGYRKDAVYAASQMIYEIISAARVHGDPLVATVGEIDVTPNVVNVVPGKALFSLDIRHTDKDALVSFTGELNEILSKTAKAHGVTLDVNMWMDEDPVPMDQEIVDIMEGYCKGNGLNYKLMHSGAGHDSQIFAPQIPTAMLFVPSRDGISHNPAEFTEPADLAEGVKALIGTLYELAYKE